MLKLIGAAGFVVLVFVFIIFGPLLTVWALNTLFPVLAIPYTFYTWLAVLVLGVTLRTKVSTK